MYFCSGFYQLAGQPQFLWKAFFSVVTTPWKYCSAQPCSWWCLCCNRWLCWITLIVLAILMFVLFILYYVFVIVATISCSSLCVLFVVLQAIGRSPTFSCFGTGPLPQPLPDTPSRSIQITAPAKGSTFIDGTTITFTAVATEPDGSQVQNPDVRWAVVFGPDNPQIPLGMGLTIMAVVSRNPDDVAANRASTQTISALVMGGPAGAAASATIQVIIAPLG